MKLRIVAEHELMFTKVIPPTRAEGCIERAQPVDAVRCVNLLARVRVKNTVINLFSKVDPPACEVARLGDVVQILKSNLLIGLRFRLIPMQLLRGRPH